MSDDARARLKAQIEACVQRGRVTLASGKTSDFYVDGRQVTLSPEGSVLAGAAALAHAQSRGATAVAGPTTGACPLVSAAGVLAHQGGVALKLAYLRSQAKDYGLQKAVEGAALGAGDRVLLVDDVITSGGSLVRAIEQVRATGAEVVGAWCLVDREEGGRERLAEVGVELGAAFAKSELGGQVIS